MNFKKEIKAHHNSKCKTKSTWRLDFFIGQRWYWLVLLTSIIATIAVFSIEAESYPLVYVRSFLGIIFALFLPGYSLLKMLYPNEIQLKTSDRIGNIERSALSLGTSIAVSSLLGLLLNFTPLGIRLEPITFGLLGVILTFSTIALVRQWHFALNS